MSVISAGIAPSGHELMTGGLRLVSVLGPSSTAGRRQCPARTSWASVNDAGEVVFVADAAGPASASALVHVSPGGTTQVLLRGGEPAPGGGRYASFGEVDLADGGRLLFQARLTGCEAAEGVFLRTGSQVRAVARAGDPAPGGGHYAGFRQLALGSYPSPAAGADVRLAYAGRTTDGRTSLVIRSPGRAPRRVMTTGARVAGGVLEDFTTSRLGRLVCVVARIRYGTSKRRVTLLASEDQLTGDERLRDGGELPELGGIGRLLTPPAICLHHAFVGLALEDGGQALVARAAGGPVRVLARSGDPAPGVAGARITKLGPPIANSGVPGGVCGVVVAVQLSGGHTGLWTSCGTAPPVIRLVATGRASALRQARRPAAAHRSPDPQSAGPGDPAVRVEAFTPVKLTNTGIVMLRSIVDLGGRPADGLVILDRIFG
jgi:hypothetical protein